MRVANGGKVRLLQDVKGERIDRGDFMFPSPDRSVSINLKHLVWRGCQPSVRCPHQRTRIRGSGRP